MCDFTIADLPNGVCRQSSKCKRLPRERYELHFERLSVRVHMDDRAQIASLQSLLGNVTRQGNRVVSLEHI